MVQQIIGYLNKIEHYEASEDRIIEVNNINCTSPSSLSSSSADGVATSGITKLYIINHHLSEYPPSSRLIGGKRFIYDDGDYWTWGNYSLKGDINGTSYSYRLYLGSASSTTFKIEIIINGTTVATFPLLTVPYDPYYQLFSGNVTGLDPTTSSGDEVIFKITKISGGAGSILYFGSAASSHITIPGNLIQSKIDAAKPRDTIIIEDGIYYENVKVNKRLTIQSKNGADKTIVMPVTPEDPVFNVTADYVNISSFTVIGAGTGIYLYNADYCNISNNICSFNKVYGIDLLYSNNNSIINNTCSNNNFGIYLKNSSNNLIKNNNVSNNSRVITIDNTTNDNNFNIIVGPITITWGDGISLYNSSNNKIYFNNFINNFDNVHPSDLANIWESTERITYSYRGTTYTNYLGNYWDDYEGTDADGDGIGDTPYIIERDEDNYPLMEPFENYFTYG